MTAFNYLTLIAIGLVVVCSGTHAVAEGDVTIVPAPTAKADSSSDSTTSADGTPVVHKSLHKKKKSKSSSSTTPATVSVTPSSSSTASTTDTTASSTPKSSTADSAKKSSHTATASTSSSATNGVKAVTTAPIVPSHLPDKTTAAAASTSANGPTVETGLPVARHNPVGTGSDPILMPVGSGAKNPGLVSPLPTAAVASYSPSYHSTTPSDNFVFTNFSKSKATYPWKTGIITTIFWIGEGGSQISATDNIGSAWDEDWRKSNRGTDNPYQRNGYAPADHAPTVNPFYVALPFNDLAYPDKARRWLPEGWHRPMKDGKQVSACKDRWVQIKNAQGRSCYAQWEDVGPLVSDHAEYVFGPERPDTLTRAGLDVSPAVAQYLGLDGNNRITSWRFVDDEDVRPGEWLKYDELALLYKAMHEQKSSNQPIQRNIEPIDDSSDDSNKKRVGAAKG